MRNLTALLEQRINDYQTHWASLNTQAPTAALPLFNYKRFLHAKDEDGNTLLHSVLQQLSDLNNKNQDTDTLLKMRALLHILQDLNKAGFNYFMRNKQGLTCYQILKDFKSRPDTAEHAEKLYIDLSSVEPRDAIFLTPARAFEQRCSKLGIPPADFQRNSNFENIQALITSSSNLIMFDLERHIYKIEPGFPALSTLAILSSIGEFKKIQQLLILRKQALCKSASALAKISYSAVVDVTPLNPVIVDEALLNNIMNGQDKTILARQRDIFASWGLTSTQDKMIHVAKRQKIAEAFELLDLNTDDAAYNNQRKINAFIIRLQALATDKLICFKRYLPITPHSQSYIENILQVLRSKEESAFPADNNDLFTDEQINALNVLANYIGLGLGYFEEYRPLSALELRSSH